MKYETSVTPEPNAVLAHPWALSVYRVEDRSAQQRILRAIRRLDRHHLTATGAQRGSEIFVIVDCDSASSAVQAKQAVMAADRHAAVAFASQSQAALR